MIKCPDCRGKPIRNYHTPRPAVHHVREDTPIPNFRNLSKEEYCSLATEVIRKFNITKGGE